MVSRQFMPLVLLMAAVGAAAADSSASDETALTVLRAARFAELNRIVLRRDCRAKPELAAVPVCRKFEVVPDEIQEIAVLPYFKKHVSEWQAAEVFAFYSSPEGQALVATLLKAVQFNNSDLLTNDQIEVLDRFNNSGEGIAMSQFARDPAQSRALLNAIEAYDPTIRLPQSGLPTSR